MDEKISVLKLEIENVERILQPRRACVFLFVLRSKVGSVAEDIQEVRGILKSVKPKSVEVVNSDTEDENWAWVTFRGQPLQAGLAWHGSKKITATSQKNGDVGKWLCNTGLCPHRTETFQKKARRKKLFESQIWPVA